MDSSTQTRTNGVQETTIPPPTPCSPFVEVPMAQWHQHIKYLKRMLSETDFNTVNQTLTSFVDQVLSRSYFQLDTGFLPGRNTNQDKFPVLQELSSRLKTFVNGHWPKPEVIHPLTLAEAGFFFTVHKDQVRCFCCGGELKNWTHGDDPMVKHLQNFPNCKFARETYKANEGAGATGQNQEPGANATGHNQELNVERAHYPSLEMLRETEAKKEEELQILKNKNRELTKQVAELEEELHTLKEGTDCIICKSSSREILFAPCNHMCTCQVCSNVLNRCCMCRSRIEERIKVYSP